MNRTYNYKRLRTIPREKKKDHKSLVIFHKAASLLRALHEFANTLFIFFSIVLVHGRGAGIGRALWIGIGKKTLGGIKNHEFLEKKFKGNCETKYPDRNQNRIDIINRLPFILNIKVNRDKKDRKAQRRRT